MSGVVCENFFAGMMIVSGTKYLIPEHFILVYNFDDAISSCFIHLCSSMTVKLDLLASQDSLITQIVLEEELTHQLPIQYSQISKFNIKEPT
jgi:hypothetical protein